MVKRIETFKRIKEQMVVLGYLPFQNLPSWCQSIPVDSIYVGFIYVILVLFVWTTWWFLIFEEKTFDQLAESVFFIFQSTLYIVMYTLLHLAKNGLLKLFEKLDNIIDRSKLLNPKSNPEIHQNIIEIVDFFYCLGMKNPLVELIYIQAEQGFENTTNKFFTYGNKIFLPIIIGPALVGSYVKYFLTHDNASFELIFVAW